MDYRVEKNKLIIEKSKEFNIKEILECGQFFRFFNNTEGYTIISRDKLAKIREEKNLIVVETVFPEYFKEFFDLDTDYEKIKKILSKQEILKYACEFGSGIRILKQEALETVISFIISANNNITRIKKIIENICEKLGCRIEDGYYAFPTLEQLSKGTEALFLSAGAGYRAPYLVDTIQKIACGYDLQRINNLNERDAEAYLKQLKGVGKKVADCILLFGYSKKRVFPVDTWIEKAYNDYFYQGKKNRKEITEHMVERYGDLSGYVQQYLFYYKREMDRKKV